MREENVERKSCWTLVVPDHNFQSSSLSFQAAVSEGTLDIVLIYDRGQISCLWVYNQKNTELPFFQPCPFWPSSKLVRYMDKGSVQNLSVVWCKEEKKIQLENLQQRNIGL